MNLYSLRILQGTKEGTCYPLRNMTESTCYSVADRVEVMPVQMSFYTAFRILAEKAMANHSGTLAWKIPWMQEPGRLQSMGSLEVRDD